MRFNKERVMQKSDTLNISSVGALFALVLMFILFFTNTVLAEEVMGQTPGLPCESTASSSEIEN